MIWITLAGHYLCIGILLPSLQFEKCWHRIPRVVQLFVVYLLTAWSTFFYAYLKHCVTHCLFQSHGCTWNAVFYMLLCKIPTGYTKATYLWWILSICKSGGCFSSWKTVAFLIFVFKLNLFLNEKINFKTQLWFRLVICKNVFFSLKHIVVLTVKLVLC